MTRYGEVITENDLSYLMDSISVYMDSDLREQIAFKYSPCTNEMFLLHYIQGWYLQIYFKGRIWNNYNLNVYVSRETLERKNLMTYFEKSNFTWWSLHFRKNI